MQRTELHFAQINTNQWDYGTFGEILISSYPEMSPVTQFTHSGFISVCFLSGTVLQRWHSSHQKCLWAPAEINMQAAAVPEVPSWGVGRAYGKELTSQRVKRRDLVDTYTSASPVPLPTARPLCCRDVTEAQCRGQAHEIPPPMCSQSYQLWHHTVT